MGEKKVFGSSWVQPYYDPCVFVDERGTLPVKLEPPDSQIVFTDLKEAGEFTAKIGTVPFDELADQYARDRREYNRQFISLMLASLSRVEAQFAGTVYSRSQAVWEVMMDKRAWLLASGLCRQEGAPPVLAKHLLQIEGGRKVIDRLKAIKRMNKVA